MTDVAVTTETVASDVTDEQTTEFFESGGEKTPEVVTPEVKEEAKTEEVKQPSPVEIELRNIKGALAEERGKRKTEAQKREQMEARFNQLMERLQTPQQEVPKFEENPAAHLLAQQQKLAEQIQQQNETVQQAEQRRQQEAQLAQFDHAYRTQASHYAQQTPEFTDAYKHLIKARHEAYEANGIDASEYAQRLQVEERQIAHTAFVLGINPGALLHSLAMTAGWKPKGQTVVKQPNIDTLAKGSSTKSLSGVAGKSQQNMTLEALAEMDDADFEKNWDKLIKG